MDSQKHKPWPDWYSECSNCKDGTGTETFVASSLGDMLLWRELVAGREQLWIRLTMDEVECSGSPSSPGWRNPASIISYQRCDWWSPDGTMWAAHNMFRSSFGPEGNKRPRKGSVHFNTMGRKLWRATPTWEKWDVWPWATGQSAPFLQGFGPAHGALRAGTVGQTATGLAQVPQNRCQRHPIN